MKKYIAILVLFFICQTGYSQSMDSLFKTFSKQEHVTKVTVGPFIIKLGSLFTNTMGVNNIEVLDFDDCSKDIKDKLTEAIHNLNDSRFETMVTTNDDDTRTRILVHIDKDMIRELVILCTGSDNTLIRIKGKIKPSDIEKVVKQHSNGC